MDSGSVRVYICGDEYSIKSDADVETIKKVAEYVDKKMLEYQRDVASRDKVKVAVLSAMNIAGELFEYRNRCRDAAQIIDDIQEKSQKIAERIETTL